MNTEILTLLLVALACASTRSDSEWSAWKKEHQKEYSDGLEELKRHNIWKANKKRIDEHNESADELGYTVGLNQFSDLETEEFQTMMLNGYTTRMPSNNTRMFLPDPNFKAAESVNWTAKGAVTRVGNQEMCGSCWAFSATGALEGQHFIKTGKLVSLSEQNLMDCSKKYGTYGCSGGFMKASFEYVRDNGGIDTESSYPYEAKDDNCRFKKADVGATCTGFVSVPSKDEHALMQAVQSIGPVSAAMDGQHFGFINYKSGIYYDPQCSKTEVNHTPLVVGFGTLDGKDYWLAKNSWGTKWGLNGYIMMARNRDNNCGIATLASYPTV